MPLGIFLIVPGARFTSLLSPQFSLDGAVIVRAASSSDAFLAALEDERSKDITAPSPDQYQILEVNFGDAFAEGGTRGVIAKFR